MPHKQKIEPIYIEPHDEITSVIERIKKSASDHIYIVVPERLSLLQSLINLKLLNRSTTSKKQKITIITSDPLTQNLASKIGIQVKKSLEGENISFTPETKTGHPEATDTPPAVNWWGAPLHDKPVDITIDEEKPKQPEINFLGKDVSPEEQSTPTITNEEMMFEEEEIEERNKTMYEQIDTNISSLRAEKPNSSSKKLLTNIKNKTQVLSLKAKEKLTEHIGSRKRNAGILLLLFLLLIFFTFLAVPHATINIYPKAIDFDQDITVQASDMVKESNFTTHQIPAVFVEASEEGGSKIATTGEKFVGTKAKGIITIKNKRSQVLLKAGTILSSTDGPKFHLLNDTLVSGAYIDELGATHFNQKTNIAIEAVEVGEDSNLAKPNDFAIESFKDTLIWGESTTRFSGGSAKKVKIVSQNDRVKIMEEVKAQVFSKAHNSLEAQKAQDLKIPAETIKTDILDEQWSAQEGEEADEVSLYLKVKSTGIAIAETDIYEVLQKAFENTIPGNFSVVNGSLKTWYELANVDEKLKALNFKGSVKALLVPYFDQDTLRNKLTFVPSENVKSIIALQSSIEFSKDPEITLWPFGTGRLPVFSSNITFIIKTDESSTTSSSVETPQTL
ncbi:MAG: hypothetical protein WCP97_02680 [bacterium]